MTDENQTLFDKFIQDNISLPELPEEETWAKEINCATVHAGIYEAIDLSEVDEHDPEVFMRHFNQLERQISECLSQEITNIYVQGAMDVSEYLAAVVVAAMEGKDSSEAELKVPVQIFKNAMQVAILYGFYTYRNMYPEFKGEEANGKAE